MTDLSAELHWGTLSPAERVTWAPVRRAFELADVPLTPAERKAAHEELLPEAFYWTLEDLVPLMADALLRWLVALGHDQRGHWWIRLARSRSVVKRTRLLSRVRRWEFERNGAGAIVAAHGVDAEAGMEWTVAVDVPGVVGSPIR
jgi:hypothetical protein